MSVSATRGPFRAQLGYSLSRIGSFCMSEPVVCDPCLASSLLCNAAFPACVLLYDGFLLGLLFDPEDGSDILLADFHWTTLYYIPEDRTLLSHSCENLFQLLISCLHHETHVVASFDDAMKGIAYCIACARPPVRRQ
jgi:hypothetical protein